ncbi:MAG: hypothetical protein EON58_20550 [Alphaproteobacteria bacterium]|nr:MAG: hypothetical protein EON58_20550 [Alphaproteobacteria bacterium]
MKYRFLLYLILAILNLFAMTSTVNAFVPNTQEFAPQNGIVAAPERPYRDELSLNGRWQFQPMRLPEGYVRNQGTPPALAPPAATAWEATPIKIPSFWNVNTWGGGRDTGEGSRNPYSPNSVTYPAIPRRGTVWRWAGCAARFASRLVGRASG